MEAKRLTAVQALNHKSSTADFDSMAARVNESLTIGEAAVSLHFFF